MNCSESTSPVAQLDRGAVGAGILNAEVILTDVAGSTPVGAIHEPSQRRRKPRWLYCRADDRLPQSSVSSALSQTRPAVISEPRDRQRQPVASQRQVGRRDTPERRGLLGVGPMKPLIRLETGASTLSQRRRGLARALPPIRALWLKRPYPCRYARWRKANANKGRLFASLGLTRPAVISLILKGVAPRRIAVPGRARLLLTSCFPCPQVVTGLGAILLFQAPASQQYEAGA